MTDTMRLVRCLNDLRETQRERDAARAELAKLKDKGKSRYSKEFFAALTEEQQNEIIARETDLQEQRDRTEEKAEMWRKYCLHDDRSRILHERDEAQKLAEQWRDRANWLLWTPSERWNSDNAPGGLPWEKKT